MKKYFIVITVLLFIYFLTLNTEDNFKERENNSMSLNNSKEERLIAVSYKGESLEMTIDDYIIHVLACEMPASFNSEALKAGAIAARTFYLYKINHNSKYVANTNDQCYNTNEEMKNKWNDDYDKFYNTIKDAVIDTSGEFISYDGNVIESFYFSMSNGYTEDIQNVFSESKPYLVSVESSWDLNLANFEKSVTFSINDFLTKLGLDNIGDVKYNILSKSNSGRIKEILINDIIFEGTDFRKKLGLRSTDFDVNFQEGNVVITTRGYGHGVGLSQYGANEMAKLGYNYKEILKYYYTGVEISTL